MGERGVSSISEEEEEVVGGWDVMVGVWRWVGGWGMEGVWFGESWLMFGVGWGEGRWGNRALEDRMVLGGGLSGGLRQYPLF